MAMRIACATKKRDKALSIDFEASKIVCLAELLKQKQDLHSVSVYGNNSATCRQVQKMLSSEKEADFDTWQKRL